MNSPKAAVDKKTLDKTVERFLLQVRSTAAGADETLIRDSVVGAYHQLTSDGLSEEVALQRIAAIWGQESRPGTTMDGIVTAAQLELHSSLVGGDTIIMSDEAMTDVLREASHLSGTEADELWNQYRPERPGTVYMSPATFLSGRRRNNIAMTWTAAARRPSVDPTGEIVYSDSSQVSLFADAKDFSEDERQRINEHLGQAGKVPRVTTLLHRLVVVDAGGQALEWTESIEERVRKISEQSGFSDASVHPFEIRKPQAVVALILRALAEDQAAFDKPKVSNSLLSPLRKSGFDGDISHVAHWPAQPVAALTPGLHHHEEWTSAAAADRQLQATIVAMAAYYESDAGRTMGVWRSQLDIQLAEGELMGQIVHNETAEIPENLGGYARAIVQRALDIKREIDGATPSQLAETHIDAEPDRWRRYTSPLHDAHTWVIDPEGTQRIAANRNPHLDVDALPSAVGLLQLGTPLIIDHQTQTTIGEAPVGQRAISVIQWEVLENSKPPTVRLTAFERSGDMHRAPRFGQPRTDAAAPPLTVAYRELVEISEDAIATVRVEDGTHLASLAGLDADRPAISEDAAVRVVGTDVLLRIVGGLTQDLAIDRISVHSQLASGEPLFNGEYRRRGSAGQLTYDPQSAFVDGSGRRFTRKAQIWLQGASVDASGTVTRRAHLRGSDEAVGLFRLGDSYDFDKFARWWERETKERLTDYYDERWAPRGNRQKRRHAVTSIRQLLTAVRSAPNVAVSPVEPNVAAGPAVEPPAGPSPAPGGKQRPA